ncbi:MAG: Asp-tRNA(Asn)/Glu-tRNA(Gln) amidotransferase subunit GatC [Dehalococcoidia bacterium]|nr:MAG: Asp-tRNA(Asn)/Glu-tRNA(Gln) amidotransferase subunit GatC [Dehalococcoidia bacterium]
MVLSNEEVRHIAWLARLGVTDAEVERFREELSVILDHFQSLEELDTRDVPGAPHASLLHNVLRDDVPTASLSSDAVLANAPDTQDSCFRVPPILE